MLDAMQSMPLTPLDTFRQQLGINPWHFWGMANSTVPLVSGCDVVKEHPWQQMDATGRADVRAALAYAETRLATELGYDIAPRYRADVLAWPWPNATDQRFRAPIQADGRWTSVQLPVGYVQAAGVEAHTALATASVGGGTLTYTDDDGDGLLDTFNIAITVPSSTPAADIALYVPASERLDDAPEDDRYRIIPARTTVTGTSAVVVGRSWICLRPILYEGYVREVVPLNPATTANYLQSIDVVRRTTNVSGTTLATSQAVLEWETLPWPAWACCDTTSADASTDPAAIGQAIARVGLRSARYGIVSAGEAIYDTTAAMWGAVGFDGCWAPDRMTVRTLAGYPLTTTNQVDPSYADIVCGYAAAELQRPICGCDTANARIYYYQTDLARTGGNAGDTYGAVAPSDLTNPFGTRRGHVRAWRFVQSARQLRGHRL
jgi:hypothetical protein